MSLAEDPTIVPAPTPVSEPSDVPTQAEGEASGEMIEAPRADVGTTIGRYVVLAEIGAGAMGRVYAAYDPRLDRRIALKVIRNHPLLRHAAQRHAARLLREAQALARLAHPNVVAVHDVEIVADGVALAMEYVVGTSLRGWLSVKRRWPEVVEMFVQAGRGLEAAHAAGVVHRDFKPDNVMIGDDGRARVVDFGLARNDTPNSETGLDALETSSTPTSLDASVTVGIAGTPAYMAPELYAGGLADARSDQFSFAVALFEALFGVRPFAGNSLASMAANVSSGQVRSPPRGHDVPTWLHRVVLRGLATKPRDRHESMAALIDALLADPRVRRRRLALAGTGALALGALGTAVMTRAGPCERAGDDLAGVWDDDVRAAVADAIAETGVTWAQTAIAHADEVLTRHAEAYRAMARDSCEATRVRAEQSEAVMDLRSGCLAARRREFAAATSLLTQVDADVARESARIVAGLGPIAACADIDALQQSVPPPADPATRARLDALRDRLADVEARTRAGKYADASERAHAIASEAEALDYPPFVAEANHAIGYLDDKLGDYERAATVLGDAGLLAARHRHDVVAARAMADAVYEIGAQLGRVDEGLLWARHAEAAAARTGDEVLIARVHNTRGLTLSTGGRLREAEAELRRALELRERALGEDHPDVSITLVNLATVLESLGLLDESLADYQRALDINRRVLGERHPSVGAVLNNSVDAHLQVGHLDEGLAAARLAHDIFAETLPGDHPNLAAAAGNIGAALWTKGDLVGARRALDEQLEINRRRLGDDHHELANSHHNLGALLHDLHDDEAARASFERAVALWTKAFGPEHAEIAGSLVALAELDILAGSFLSARERLRRALQLLEAADAGARIEHASAVRMLAEVELELGDTAAATAAIERALAELGGRPERAGRLAKARLVHAQILWAKGDRQAALAAAENGRTHCPERADACAELDAALRRWRRAPAGGGEAP
ncbi:MAG: serine/threonine protein kinase [Deltaproteobacteria bacterium]|nr:serine/threonine protein kinase [Deltaproteobacteria bacterium]MBK8716004.1 serine/threonine protein kinase [Deltaproteobacteria bacterium]MBP7289919.1 serine/threonine protein kinase [Nannocystaceae bacterium]